MYAKIPFSENELKIVGTTPAMYGRPDISVRNTPVSPRQNTIALFYEKHPFWIQGPSDTKMFMPDIYSLNLGRGVRADCTDAFGVRWQYVPSAGGSIVAPGEPLLKDANDWEKVIKFPDLDSWDWEAAAEENKIDAKYSCQATFYNGFWFERLISFMDFAPAAMALIDEDQTDALKALFQATTDFGCKVVDKFCEYWPLIDGFNVHDDWGSQKAPFFSNEVAYELFVPYMKQFTDHIHSLGRYATIHSCGHNEERIQCYIDAGFDEWRPQPMNNMHKLYEEFGDKIIISINPDIHDSENMTEEQLRQAARDFVDEYCKPGKPSIFSYSASALPDAFFEELYAYSRKKLLEQ